MKLKLFSQETDDLIKAKAKKEKKPKELSVSDLKWELRKEKMKLAEYEKQDESNFTDFDKSVKGKEANIPLIRNHIAYYTKQIAEKRTSYEPVLNKWRDFIVNLCKEKGKEIDMIAFDESAPYDCEVALRLKGHRCYSHCVSFRFQRNRLKAYDSHFGGGTSFLDSDINEETTIKEIMERVFNEECSKSGWEDSSYEHRQIKVDERGWEEE